MNQKNHKAPRSDGFDRFDLHPALLKGVAAMGFTEPRPIQAEAIGPALDGRDVLGLAQTGTGKTAAFALPLLDMLMDGDNAGPHVLVLAPTRELATQIAEEFRALAKFTDIQVATVFGGVSQHKQVQALRRRPEVVVGCPGRVLDLMGQGLLHFKALEALVLDEADHMFDMGFLRDIRKILGKLPKDRQNLLFSATMPREIRSLANEVLHDPAVVELAKSAPAETIDHALYAVDEGQKRDLLNHFLDRDDCRTAIVFTRTKHRARRLAQQLEKQGVRAVGLQGNMSQGQRDRAMQGFRNGKFDVLVATDIVARGIDVSAVSHVINYDVPNTPEAYTHRIGRTGRSELEGRAATFVTAQDTGWVRDTEKMLGEPIERREVAGFEAGFSLDSRPAGGSRPSKARPGGGRSGAPRKGRGGGGKRRSSSSRGRSQRASRA